MLKIQNEDLSAKLRRSEVFLSRVKEELAQYRASIGRNPYINFDEEQRLNNKLKVSEYKRPEPEYFHIFAKFHSRINFLPF